MCYLLGQIKGLINHRKVSVKCCVWQTAQKKSPFCAACIQVWEIITFPWIIFYQFTVTENLPCKTDFTKLFNLLMAFDGLISILGANFWFCCCFLTNYILKCLKYLWESLCVFGFVLSSEVMNFLRLFLFYLLCHQSPIKYF